jgi:predicted nucleic acid-binding protein
MRIFLDANILVAVINKEYPLFTYASRIMSLTDNSRYEVFTSPLCLAIAFYFAEKRHKTKVAGQKIKMIGENISIADITGDSVKKVLQYAAINDFEDGLEYYAAIESKCRCIVTEDVRDFYFSDMEVLNSESFFNKYMAGRNPL